MALFEVPGWSVSSTLASASTSRVSKKRKRPGSNPESGRSTEVNLEKLVKKLHTQKSTDIANSRTTKNRHKNKGKKRIRDAALSKAEDDTFERSADEATSTLKLATPHDTLNKKSTSPTVVSKKKEANKIGKDGPSTPGVIEDLTAMQKVMKQSLDGARFRYDLSSI